MRKKCLLSLFISISAIGLVACGNNSATVDVNNDVQDAVETTADSEEADAAEATNEEVEEYYDDQFLEDLSKAIQTRWQLIEEEDLLGQDKSFEQDQEDYKKLVEAELQILDGCRDKKYQDSKLQEFAISYSNGLSDQMSILEEASNKNLDEKEFYKKWNEAIDKRSEALFNIYSEYDLKIDSKYIKYIDTLNTKACINKYGKDKFREEINKMFSESINSETGEDGNDIIKAVLKNQTGEELKNLTIYAYIVEGNGTKEDSSDDECTEIIEYIIGDWKPDDEVQVTFTRTKPTTESDPYIILDID